MPLELTHRSIAKEVDLLSRTIADIDTALASPDFYHEDTQEVIRSKEYFSERLRTIQAKIARISIQETLF